MSSTSAETGYPDYSAFPVAQSLNLFPALVQTLPAGITDTVVFPTTHFASVQVFCVAQTGVGQLSMVTSTDAAGLNQFAIDTLLLRDGGVVQPRFPIRGPFMKLRINNTSGSPQNFLTFAALQSTAAPTMAFPITSAITSDTGFNLAASTAKTYQLVVMKPGLANLFLNSRDATAHLTMDVFATDENATLTFYVNRFAASAAPINTQIVLPARPVSVTITNTDGAAAHQYDFSLVCPPSIG